LEFGIWRLEFLNMELYLKELEDRLKMLVQKFDEELKSVRTSRPSVQLIEDIKVNYYDQNLPIKQLGSLGIRPPRDIEITAWDKNAVGPIAKAIEDAKRGFSVSADGTVVRVTLPPLTDERRAEFTRHVKKMSEEVRIQVRHRRDETIKELKSAQDGKELNEDQVFKGKEKIQKIVDETNGKIESALENKLKELSE